MYKKLGIKIVALFVMLYVLSSCTHRRTDIFFDATYQSTYDSLENKSKSIRIEKSAKYYLGVITLSEFDKFESDIYGQLRMALYSEARFKYPNYQLINLTQSREGNIFQTEYEVSGDLLPNKEFKKKLNYVLETIPDKSLNRAVTPKKEGTVSVVGVSKDTLEEPLASKEVFVDSIDSNLAPTEKPKIVYVVACFEPSYFNLRILQNTADSKQHPVRYFQTDNWVRIYLEDIKSLKAARAIDPNAWPCRYGE